MKRTLKDRLLGVVLGILIGATLVTTAAATTGKIQKMLDYTDIKITLDGEEIIPKDANGKYVEPFAIEGTTYLPVRAISNALGLNVGWDQATKTVILTSPQKEVISEEGNVIYNENGIKVTYNGYTIDEKSVKYFIINLLIENNSSQTVTLYSDTCSINGFMVDSLMVAEVSPNKKINGEFYIRETNFTKNKIDVNNIEDIEIQFYYKSNGNYVDSDPIKLLSSPNNTQNNNNSTTNSSNSILYYSGTTIPAVENLDLGLAMDEARNNANNVVYVYKTNVTENKFKTYVNYLISQGAIADDSKSIITDYMAFIHLDYNGYSMECNWVNYNGERYFSVGYWK